MKITPDKKVGRLERKVILNSPLQNGSVLNLSTNNEVLLTKSLLPMIPRL